MTFALEGRREGAARLEVFDTAGRLVAVRDVAEGAPASSWDGRVRDGARAGAGVYFARVRENGRAALAKFVLLRR